jgi:hypothetical protein
MYKFLSQPTSIACTLVLFAMLTLGFGVAFGRDDTSKTYRCTAKDAVSVQADGTFNKEKEIGEIGREHFDRMVINVQTGIVSYPHTGILETRVVQKNGPDDKNYVLVPSFSFQSNKTAANTANDFIRLHATAGNPHFIAFWLSYLVIGTCEIVR